MRGRFIVLEGVDGTGKTTLAKRLADLVGDAVVTSEPTSGRIGSALRSGELGTYLRRRRPCFSRLTAPYTPRR